MKLQLVKGSTDVSVYVFIQDSSSSTGAGLTGLVFNSASLVCYYVRPLGNATQISLVTQTVTGAHSDGGFVEVDAANMPGIYRLDLPDAVCATGVDFVVAMMKGATNMAPLPLEIQLTNIDLNSVTALGTAPRSYLVDDGVNPVEGADVWISRDITGDDVIWHGTSDSLGIARTILAINGERKMPYLDPGKYYFWVQKLGYSPPSWPDVEVFT